MATARANRLIGLSHGAILMTLNDNPWPRFQGHAIISREISHKRYYQVYRHTYNGLL